MSFKCKNNSMKAFTLYASKVSLLHKRWFSTAKLKLFQTNMPKMSLVIKPQAKPLHIPIMVDEALSGLNIHYNSVILDMTFGAGGHSEKILNKYPNCHVIALDCDEEAYEIANTLSQNHSGRVTPLLGKFSQLDKLLNEKGYSEASINGVLIDAGCSSMQFDQPQRGFSLSKDGPLDMRMTGTRDKDQITAADVVNYLDVKDLTQIISKYGEELNAEVIARAIVENRPFNSTKQLAKAIASPFLNTVSRINSIGKRSHIATKTFMAIRIFVNDEFNELAAGIKCAEKYLADEGRLVVLTFHSLEHRLVRRILHKPLTIERTSLNKKRKRKVVHYPWTINKDLPYIPSVDEVDNNPRARSAVLRVAIRNRDVCE